MDISELKKVINQNKRIGNGNNRQMQGREDGTHEQKDKTKTITQSEIQRGNRLNESEPSLRDLWGKRFNIVSLQFWKKRRVRLTKCEQK